VFGYAAFKTDRIASIGSAIPALYFMGCEMVMTDMARGQIATRPGYRLMCKIIRKGDHLLLASAAAFGIKPELQVRHIAKLEAMGVEVMTLTPEAEVLRHAA
jgi:DNA invertase Pin-like site-specific DNA recombinase